MSVVSVSFSALCHLSPRPRAVAAAPLPWQNFAKTLVNADRASLFMLDARSKELFARIFDTGADDETSVQQEIRSGLRGYVLPAVTGLTCQTMSVLRGVY